MTRNIPRWLAFVATPIVVLGSAKYHAVFIGKYELTGSTRSYMIAFYCATLIVGLYSSGLPEYFPKMRSALIASSLVCIVGAIAISLVQLAVAKPLIPRFVIATSSAFLIPIYAGLTLLYRRLNHAAGQRDRVFFVGIDPSTFELDSQAQLENLRPYSVSGVFVDGESLPQMVSDVEATVIVVSGPVLENDELTPDLKALHELGLRIRTLPAFYSEWIGKSDLSELKAQSLMFDVGEVHGRIYPRQKRILDIAFGIICMPVILTAIPLVWFTNLLVNRGPLFYTQPRVGKNNEVFQIMKFRSMKPNSDLQDWTAENDKRITLFGKFLRKTHIDELPQSINILKGDLSIVGPRPEQPQYVEKLKTEIPFYEVRHLVQPGLSGWAQTSRGYGSSIEDAKEKLQYDIWYMQNQSISLDWRILGRTLRAIVRMNGK